MYCDCDVGALNGLLTTWVLLKVQEHQLAWRAWRDSTLHVRVALGASSASLATVVPDPDLVRDTSATDRATNVADPFMVALPYTLPEP